MGRTPVVAPVPIHPQLLGRHLDRGQIDRETEILGGGLGGLMWQRRNELLALSDRDSHAVKMWQYQHHAARFAYLVQCGVDHAGHAAIERA